MTNSTTGAPAKAGASGRSGTRAATNGKPKRAIRVKDLRLTVQESVPVGIFRAAFKDEATNEDAIQFLEAALGEEQMEQIWAVPLELADGPIADQVNALLLDLQDKVQKVLGLEPGE